MGQLLRELDTLWKREDGRKNDNWLSGERTHVSVDEMRMRREPLGDIHLEAPGTTEVRSKIENRKWSLVGNAGTFRSITWGPSPNSVW